MSSCRFIGCRIVIVLVVFCFSCCSTRYADKQKPTHNRCADRIKAESDAIGLELPRISGSEMIIKHFAYTVSYNTTTLNSNWVAYELTRAEADGDEVSRSGRSFVQDPDFGGRQPNYYDYNNTGWDKGHLAPAADMKWSEVAMDECFYFTNCSPQNHEFNGGMWNSLEKNVRSWARKFGQVYVVTGPVFSENKYGTIGTDKVAIPDAFFKACLVPKENGFSGIGFIMDNAFIGGNLNQHACTIDELEKIIGLDLFCGLNDNLENEVEAVVKWGDWGLAKPK